jgi:hypothetical protein
MRKEKYEKEKERKKKYMYEKNMSMYKNKVNSPVL